MTAPRIVTSESKDPACPAHLRWCAYDDRTFGGEETDPIGWGETEQEAIDDLMEQLEDGNDD